MMHAEQRQRQREWAEPVTPRIVVARAGRWTTVDLRKPYTVERNGKRVVNLADVWVAGGLRGDLFALAFDFLDASGNAASLRGEPRLDAIRFVRGWLDVETRDVSWDTDELVPTHWYMRGVATIVAVNPGALRQAPARRRR